MADIYLVQSKNPSYALKGRWVAEMLQKQGLGEWVREIPVDELSVIPDDAEVVFADSYADIQSAIETWDGAAVVKVLPEQLLPEQAAHAARYEVHVLLPATRVAGLESFIECDIVWPVDDIPAAPIAGSWNKLQELYPDLAVQIDEVASSNKQVSVFYAPGHFTSDAGSDKVPLNDQDIDAFIASIHAHNGAAIVVTGGRVTAEVLEKIKQGIDKDIPVIAQNAEGVSEVGIDAMSAVCELALERGLTVKPYVDGLAGTTWATLAGSGVKLVDTHVIVSGNMLDSPGKRVPMALELARKYADGRMEFVGVSPEQQAALLEKLADMPEPPKGLDIVKVLGLGVTEAYDFFELNKPERGGIDWDAPEEEPHGQETLDF